MARSEASGLLMSVIRTLHETDTGQVSQSVKYGLVQGDFISGERGGEEEAGAGVQAVRHKAGQTSGPPPGGSVGGHDYVQHGQPHILPDEFLYLF